MTDTKTYWIAPDAYQDIALWSGTGPDDPHCDCVVYKRSLDGMDPILWPTIVAALVKPSAPMPKFAIDQSVQLMVCAEVVDVVITGVSQEELGFNYGIQDSGGNLASCWEHELRVATTGSDAR